MKKVLVVLFCAIMLSGCLATRHPVKVVYINSNFNKDKAHFIFEKGNNTIMGSALIRQRGGGVVTCAGMKVDLIPVTAHAKERITYIYGNSKKGYRDLQAAHLNFGNTSSADYFNYMKKKTCDAQGKFVFRHVADGEYYLTTTVLWMRRQGGVLMAKVSVSNGVTEEVVLTPH
jgi:hypothetical protein